LPIEGDLMSSVDQRTRSQKAVGIVITVVTKAFWLAVLALMLLLGNLPKQ
jgi:hypothetical protein